MLVLSRRIGDKILIGDDITVLVIEVDKDRCRLGFTAPRSVSIDREEVRRERAIQTKWGPIEKEGT